LALETLFVRDSSPFEQKDPKNPTDRRFQKKLTTADTKWLAELAEATGHGELVVRLEEGREDEPLVTRDPDGTWRAGRYIGSITFKDRTLVIEPRFGDALLSWCAAAFNLVLVETPGTPQYSDWIVPWLIATLWSRSFVAAARHGLPALRTDVRETGLAIRGRLDVQGTIPLRAASSPAAASVRRVKSVEHAISAAIVAAYQELTRLVGAQSRREWPPKRVKELMSPLIAAVGTRPSVPSIADIEAVRLTPITAGFRSLALLSARIAKRRGASSAASTDAQCHGVLLDVAELWELYVLAALRKAWPDMDVMHGTHESDDARALLLNANGRRLGNLKPDALLRANGKNVAVVDAKYKRLHPTRWSQAPQREDLYQLAAYIGRYGDDDTPMSGALAYPLDPEHRDDAPAERDGPWFLNSGKKVQFLTLAHDIDEAATKLRNRLGCMVST
jgi:5-methylcytosine-specific restriction enzyme subunit McrC